MCTVPLYNLCVILPFPPRTVDGKSPLASPALREPWFEDVGWNINFECKDEGWGGERRPLVEPSVGKTICSFSTPNILGSVNTAGLSEAGEAKWHTFCCRLYCTDQGQVAQAVTLFIFDLDYNFFFHCINYLYYFFFTCSLCACCSPCLSSPSTSCQSLYSIFDRDYRGVQYSNCPIFLVYFTCSLRACCASLPSAFFVLALFPSLHFPPASFALCRSS